MPETPLLRQRRPFSRQEALAAGLTVADLRGPLVHRVFRNAYVPASLAQHPLTRIRAALHLHPGSAFASHESAATAYRLPVPHTPEVHVTVATEADRRRREGIRHHLLGTATGTASHWVHGVRVSRPERLFVELADSLDLVQLVTAGDALVRHGWVTPEQLVAMAGQHPGRRAKVLRRAARLVRRAVDSPMESRLRLLLVLAGLPEPTVNHVIRREDGSVRFRFDLCYPGLLLLVEYDGRQHREDLEQWDRDTARQDWFDQTGWRRVAVFSWGIYRRPDQTVARVAAAIRDRGGQAPRVLSGEWRRYFPVIPDRATA